MILEKLESSLVMSKLKVPPVRMATPRTRLHCGPTGLNEAILSLNFLRSNNETATTSDKPLLTMGSVDKEINLWCVGEMEDIAAKGDSALEFISSLSGHDRSLDRVLFSHGRNIFSTVTKNPLKMFWKIARPLL